MTKSPKRKTRSELHIEALIVEHLLGAVILMQGEPEAYEFLCKAHDRASALAEDLDA